MADLDGKRLFWEPLVRAETYRSTPAEEHFYHTLSEFIVTGKAYAGTLDRSAGEAVVPVPVTMQKLASSSVAAVRRALHRRLEGTARGRERLAGLGREVARHREYQGDGDDDAASELEERLAEASARLSLTADEEPRLRELVAAADAVGAETKVEAILGLLRGPFAGRTVLLFTEYKATQSMLLSRLHAEFGPESAASINGDGRADGVTDAAGTARGLHQTRAAAADRFNAGAVRIPVSTEASGEGVDLQRHRFSLVHVDLPWNPMRMQQRVGRLDRYGQTRRVEIDTARNPDAVEARIWDKLNAKIAAITRALGPVMARPEDLLQSVKGTASPELFRGAFAESGGVPAEDLTGWFDTRTAQFGGRDALAAVRAPVGNAARFDFREASAQIPRLDLPDLKPFFELMLHVNRRRVAGGAGGLEFQTPEGWRGAVGVRPADSGMAFDRAGADPDPTLGVGHKVVDAAVAQARGLTAVAAGVPDDLLPAPLAVFRVTDRVTTGAGVVRAVTVGVSGASGDFTLVRDWELVRDLNRVLGRDPRRHAVAAVADAAGVAAAVAEARGWLSARLGPLDLPFRYPELAVTCVLVPGPRVAADEIGTPRA